LLRIEDNLLIGANFIESPNCSERDGEEISLLVIHNISLPPNQFGNNYVEEFFLNKLDSNSHAYFKEINNLKVSSHLFIKRDGSITQFVPFNLKAWHAGVSDYKGRDNCNDFSIGIEMEGADDIEYTEDQYKSLSKATNLLMNSYPLIKIDRIVGHSEISPSRKTDPGPSFSWSKYKSYLS